MKLTTRQRINDFVREYGNQLIKFKDNYGLGDLLTTKTTCRDIGEKVGRICGLLMYPAATNLFTLLWARCGATAAVLYTMTGINTFISIAYMCYKQDLAMCGVISEDKPGEGFAELGYGVGELLDSLIGEPSPRTIRWRKLDKKIKAEQAFFGDITNFMTKEEIEEGIAVYGSMKKFRKRANLESKLRMARLREGGRAYPL